MNRVSCNLKRWLIAGRFFIPHLRIRNDTQRGQLESQEMEKEPNGLCEKIHLHKSVL